MTQCCQVVTAVAVRPQPRELNPPPWRRVQPESLSRLYTSILVLGFAMNHTTEPLSRRHHRVWLMHVSEEGLDHYAHVLNQQKLLVVG